MVERRDIYLIRHARPDLPMPIVPYKECNISPIKDKTLNRIVNEIPKNPVLVQSSLKRARQTMAEIIKRKWGNRDERFKSVKTIACFDEQDLGCLEGKTFPEAWKLLGSLPPHNWGFFPANFRPESGESFLEMSLRVSTAFDRLSRIDRKHDILLVCHSGVIKAIISYIYGISAEQAMGIEISHMSLTLVRQIVNKRWGKEALGGDFTIGYVNRIF